MKTLVLVGLLASVAYGDQAADAFGTGFSNALQRAIEAKQQEQANYVNWREQQTKQDELQLLKEQVEIQRQELELQQRERREKIWNGK